MAQLIDNALSNRDRILNAAAGNSARILQNAGYDLEELYSAPETIVHDADTPYLDNTGYRVKRLDALELNPNKPQQRDSQSKLLELAEARKKKLETLKSKYSVDDYNKSLAAINDTIAGLQKDKLTGAVEASQGQRAAMAGALTEVNMDSGPNIVKGLPYQTYQGFVADKDNYEAWKAGTAKADEKAFTKTLDYQTGNRKDVYGRTLVENPEYAKYMVEQGYAVPTDEDSGNVDAMQRAALSGTGAWADPKAASELSGKYTDAYGYNTDNNWLSNAVRAVGSGALNLGAKTTELIGEGLETIGATGAGEGLQKLGSDFQRLNLADQMTGFDSGEVKDLGKEATQKWNNGDYIGAVFGSVFDTRIAAVIGQSIPEMAELAYLMPLAIANNVNHNMNVAKENKGSELTTSEKVQSALITTASTVLDRLGDKLALSGAAPVRKHLQSVIDKMSTGAKDTMVKKYGPTVLSIGSMPTRVVAGMAGEGVTEYAQTLGETAAQNVDIGRTRGFKAEELEQAKEAGVLGAASGGWMTIGGMAANKVLEVRGKKVATSTDVASTVTPASTTPSAGNTETTGKTADENFDNFMSNTEEGKLFTAAYADSPDMVAGVRTAYKEADEQRDFTKLNGLIGLYSKQVKEGNEAAKSDLGIITELRNDILGRKTAEMSAPATAANASTKKELLDTYMEEASTGNVESAMYAYNLVSSLDPNGKKRDLTNKQSKALKVVTDSISKRFKELEKEGATIEDMVAELGHLPKMINMDNEQFVAMLVGNEVFGNETDTVDTNSDLFKKFSALADSYDGTSSYEPKEAANTNEDSVSDIERRIAEAEAKANAAIKQADRDYVDGKITQEEATKIVDEENAKAEEVKSRYSKEAIDARKSVATEDSIEGISGRTINKLARVFKVDPAKVAASLDIAMANLSVMNMKNVSKKANDIQYDTYYNEKTGILPLFIKYKKQLSMSEHEKAAKTLNILRTVARNRGVRYKQYETIYNNIAEQLQDVIENEGLDEAIEFAKDIDATDAIRTTVRKGGHKMSAKAILVDMYAGDEDTQSKIAADLKVPVQESNTLKIMRSSKEAMDTINSILEKEGQKPVTVSGKVVSTDDQLQAYRSKIEDEKLEEKVSTLEAELEAAKNEAAGIASTGTPRQVSKAKARVAALTKELADVSKNLSDLKEGMQRASTRRFDKSFKADPDTGNIDTKVTASKSGKTMGSMTSEEKAKMEEEGKDTSDIVVDDKKATASKEEIKGLIQQLKDARAELEKAKGDKNRSNAEIENKAQEKYDAVFEKVKAKLDKKDKYVVSSALKEYGEVSDSHDTATEYFVEAVDSIVKMSNAIDRMKEQRKNVKHELSLIEKAQAKLDTIEDELVDTKVAADNMMSGIAKDSVAEGKGISVSKVKEAIKELATSSFKAMNKMYKLGKVVYTRLAKSKAKEILEDELTRLDKAIAKLEKKEAAKRARAEAALGNKKLTTEFVKVSKYKKNIRQHKDKATKDIVDRVAKANVVIDSIKEKLSSGAELLMALESSLSTGAREVYADKEGQPLHIKDMIKVKGNIVNTLSTDELLSMIDDAAVRKDLKDIIDVTSKALENKMFKANSSNARPDYIAYASVFGSLLLQNNGKLSQPLVNAIAIAVHEYAGANGSSLMINSDEDIVRMRGLIETSQLTPTEKRLLRRGRYLSIVADQLGRNILAEAGISNDSMSRAHYAKMVSDAGRIGIAVLEDMGFVKDVDDMANGIKKADFDAMVEESKTGSTSANAKGTDGTESGAYVKMVKGIDTKKNRDKLKTMKEKVGTVLDALTIDKTMKTYREYKVSKKKQESKKYGVRGSILDAPKEAQDTLKVLENVPFSMVTGAVKKYVDKVEKDPKAADMFKRVLGYKDIVEMAKAGSFREEIEAQISKNDEVEKSIDDMMTMYHRVESGDINNEVFFDWFFAQNGRYMLDSVNIQPQTDKKNQRFTISATETDRVWDKNDKKDMMYFTVHIAQAFGHGIDKKDTKSSIAIGNAILRAVKSDVKGTMTIDDLVSAVFNGHIMLGDTKLDIEHPGHALQAIQAIETYVQSGDKFKAVMAAEYDQLTSGFMFKLMQLPVLDREQLKEWLAKTGVFIKEDGEYGYKITDKDGNMLGMNDIIAAGTVLDSYRTLATAVNDKMVDATIAVPEGKEKSPFYAKIVSLWKVVNGNKNLALTLVDEKGVTSAGRNLFKYPFMTFNYAASIGSIMKSIGFNMAEDLVKKMITTPEIIPDEFKTTLAGSVSNYDKMVAEIKQGAIDIANDKASATMMYDVKIPGTGLNLMKTLATLFEKTYGAQTGVVMNSTFGNMIRANTAMTDATQIMFRVFKMRADEKVLARINSKNGTSFKSVEEFHEALKDEGNKGKYKGVTDKEMDEISLELGDVFPSIRSPYSAGKKDGIAIIDEQVSENTKSELEATSTYLKGKEGKLARSKVQSMVKEYVEARSAGAVVPIHWVDGSVIAQLLSKGGILGIHDAIIVGDDIEQNILAMNKAIFDVAGEYNMMEEIIDALNMTLDSMTDKDLANIGDFGSGQDIRSFTQAIENILEINEIVQENRAYLASHEITIGNVAAPAGTMYTGKLSSKASLQEELGKIGLNSNTIEDITSIINKAIEEGCN